LLPATAAIVDGTPALTVRGAEALAKLFAEKVSVFAPALPAKVKSVNRAVPEDVVIAVVLPSNEPPPDKIETVIATPACATDLP
jgi:hypothetical protein